jgi:hypothetical protein
MFGAGRGAVKRAIPDVEACDQRAILGENRLFVGARVKPGHDGRLLDLNNNRHART